MLIKWGDLSLIRKVLTILMFCISMLLFGCVLMGSFANIVWLYMLLSIIALGFTFGAFFVGRLHVR